MTSIDVWADSLEIEEQEFNFLDGGLWFVQRTFLVSDEDGRLTKVSIKAPNWRVLDTHPQVKKPCISQALAPITTPVAKVTPIEVEHE